MFPNITQCNGTETWCPARTVLEHGSGKFGVSEQAQEAQTRCFLQSAKEISASQFGPSQRVSRAVPRVNSWVFSSLQAQLLATLLFHPFLPLTFQNANFSNYSKRFLKNWVWKIGWKEKLHFEKLSFEKLVGTKNWFEWKIAFWKIEWNEKLHFEKLLGM